VRRGSCLTVAGALLATLAVASSAAAAPNVPLGQSGRWITDAKGRTVILHGVNMVYKRPPYHPAAAGFNTEDARFLRRHGFNTVRLGLIYAGVEPAAGAYDEAYLDRIAATETMLAKHRIFSQLDFHQDLYNERFQGEGWADWAVDDDGLPNQPQSGFPANYFAMPALIRAFDHFWANDPGPGDPQALGLQDRYAAAFGRVAQRFAKHKHTMGYDLMNEPWPGTAWSTCANPTGCPVFDNETLAPFHQRALDQIRRFDKRKLVWYEPNVLFNFGADSHHPDLGDPRLGFSFHVYCLAGSLGFSFVPTTSCTELDELVFDNADKQASETSDALLLSEFGATDDLSVIERNVEQAEQHLVSWQYWHYCECGDPTTSGPGVQGLVFEANRPPTGANVKRAKLAVLSRPYPQLTSGTPVSVEFDSQTKRFRFVYSTEGPSGAKFVPKGAPVRRKRFRTEIHVPKIHYPRGYKLDLEGAGLASKRNARVLKIVACPGREQVSVTVRPPRSGPPNRPDCRVTPRAKRKRAG
jgi:endoglycosylceramidase